MAAIIALIVAYLLGSLNSAVLIAKYLKLPDPRSTGSGNAGATNVLRTIGKNQAIVVLIADFLKGFLAILIGHILGVQDFILGLVALCAVLGHVYPVFFKFKGGKGTATMMGATVMLAFWVGVIAIAVWIAIAVLIRYASLASLAAAICVPLLLLIFGSYTYVFPLLLVAGLIVWQHWANIERLRNRTESKITLRSDVAKSNEKTTAKSSPPSQKPSDNDNSSD